MGGSSSVVVGFKYYLGLHKVLGYRGLTLKKFIVDGRTAWSGSASTGSITVDAKELFGGEPREGGVSGTIEILDGGPTQQKNPYLQEHIGPLIPAYRGVFSLLLKNFYIGNNPYLKNMAWEVQRTNVLTDGSAQWNITKANINDGDLNAAHIIRECLTNSAWGMDYPTSIIDNAAFTAAADTLYTEGFGLTMLWNQPESIEQFVQRVLDHINGVLQEDPATGDIGLFLIRDDYTPASLLLLDESNVISLESFERRGWGETINEVTVTYHDRATDKDTPVTVQDIGNIQIQGSVVNQSKQYPGIPNANLAMRVAMRDLRAASSPLSKIEIVVNRMGWTLRRADVFRFSWPELGISEVVYRIIGVDGGEPTNSKIKITAMEDVWGLPTSTYTAPQVNGWVIPNNPPAPATYQQVVEASYWDVQQNVTQADIAQLGADFGFVLAQAVKPTNDSYNYKMMCRVGAAAYEEEATGSFCPTAELDGAISYATGGLTDAVLSIKNPIDLDDVEVDTFAYIGNEIVAVKAVDTGSLTVTVDRGVLDSVPEEHADSTRIWFADTNQAFDITERVDAEDVDVKLLPSTGLGTLPIGSASALNLILDSRYQRPYPPGNVRFNGAAYPATISGFLTITWSHRDRTLQTAYLNDQTEGDIGPEAGTTYNLRVYGDGDVEIANETGLTGTSYQVDEAALSLQGFIQNTWAPTGFHLLHNMDQYNTNQIEDFGANPGTNHRTLYGGAAYDTTRLLMKESKTGVRFAAVGDYIGQSDIDVVANDTAGVLAVVQFDTDLTGTRCIVQDGGNTRGFYFGLHGGLFGVWIQDPTNGNKTGTVTASTYLSADTPTMVGCLVDGAAGWIRLYVDGVKIYEDLAVGTFNDFNGTNGTSYGGCYQVLAIDNSPAPIGGMLGNIDFLLFTSFSGASIQSYMENEFWTYADLNTYDWETEVAADSPYVRLKMDEASGTLVNSIGAYGDGTPNGTVTYEEAGLVFNTENKAIKLGATAYLQNHDWADYIAAAADGFTLSIKLIYPSTSALIVWFGVNQSDVNRTNRLLLGFNTNKAYANVENSAQTLGTTTYAAGDKLHCFFIYDKVSNDWAYYINDVLECSGNRVLSVAASDYSSIGMEEDSGGVPGNYLASTIDEFVLHQTELTPARISVLTEAGRVIDGLHRSIRVELESVRDGLTSRQMHNISTSR